MLICMSVQARLRDYNLTAPPLSMLFSTYGGFYGAKYVMLRTLQARGYATSRSVVCLPYRLKQGYAIQ